MEAHWSAKDPLWAEVMTKYKFRGRERNRLVGANSITPRTMAYLVRVAIVYGVITQLTVYLGGHIDSKSWSCGNAGRFDRAEHFLEVGPEAKFKGRWGGNSGSLAFVTDVHVHIFFIDNYEHQEHFRDG